MRHPVFILIAALFTLKLVSNAIVPLALVSRPKGPKGENPGVSLMPCVEVILLVVLVGLAGLGWAPLSAWHTGLGGILAILASYLLMFPVAVLITFLTRIRRRGR